MKTPDQVLDLVKRSIDSTIQRIGPYVFQKEGPLQLSNYDDILNEMKSLDPEDARKVLEEVHLYVNEGVTGEATAEILLAELEM